LRQVLLKRLVNFDDGSFDRLGSSLQVEMSISIIAKLQFDYKRKNLLLKKLDLLLQKFARYSVKYCKLYFILTIRSLQPTFIFV